MRLGQIQIQRRRDRRRIRRRNGAAHSRTTRTVDLIRRAEVGGDTAGRAGAARSPAAIGETVAPVLPIHPPEVWACGCTYETSASFRDAEHGTREGMYAYVYREPRPEIFFKGTARVCVGPGQADRHPLRFEIHRARAGTGAWCSAAAADRRLHAGQRRLGLGHRARERAVPAAVEGLHGCCALGPVIVTADELPDPYNLEMTCTIMRDGAELFAGSDLHLQAAPAVWKR